VGEIYGVPLAGLLAWLAWRFYYLSQMPTLRRKLRVMMEWLWGAFFSVDLTHLRFTRSGGEVEPEDTPAASTGTAAPPAVPSAPAPASAPAPDNVQGAVAEAAQQD
jgi:NADH dehydrogenase